MNVRPIATILGVVVVVEAVLLLTDTGPNVWLVGASIWFATTIDRIAARPVPTPPPPSNTTWFPDLRTTTLRQALATGSNDERHTRRLREQLVAIIDDELLTVHGVDRRADPDAARAVLGRELARFADGTDVGAPLTPRDVTRIVTRIEALDTERTGTGRTGTERIGTEQI